MAPIVAKLSNDSYSIIDVLHRECESHIKDIQKSHMLLCEKEYKIKEKEKELNAKIAELAIKEQEIYKSRDGLAIDKYMFYKNILDSGFAKDNYVRLLVREFWDEKVRFTIDAGVAAGKTIVEVRQEISYLMVNIYYYLGDYASAYDWLIEQVNGRSFIIVPYAKNIVDEVGYCDRLKKALYDRLKKRDLNEISRKEFIELNDWLVGKYK